MVCPVRTEKVGNSGLPRVRLLRIWCPNQRLQSVEVDFVSPQISQAIAEKEAVMAEADRQDAKIFELSAGRWLMTKVSEQVGHGTAVGWCTECGAQS